MTYYVRPRSSIAPAVDPLIAGRLERADQRRADRFLDVMLGLLVLLVLFIVFCLPPPGAAG